MIAVALNDFRSLLRDSDRRARIATILLVGAILALQFSVAVLVAILVSRFIPIEQRVRRVVTDVHVQKVERIVVPVPPRQNYPPLKDPKEACKGAPVVINRIVVAGTTKDEKATTSWFTVRPAGDDYLVYCRLGGDTDDMWQHGDLIRLYGGQPG